MDHFDRYADRSILITGGLGFIGSNLARRLGARVTLVDSLAPDYGGNCFAIRRFTASLGSTGLGVYL